MKCYPTSAFIYEREKIASKLGIHESRWKIRKHGKYSRKWLLKGYSLSKLTRLLGQITHTRSAEGSGGWNWQSISSIFTSSLNFYSLQEPETDLKIGKMGHTASSLQKDEEEEGIQTWSSWFSLFDSVVGREWKMLWKLEKNTDVKYSKG